MAIVVQGRKFNLKKAKKDPRDPKYKHLMHAEKPQPLKPEVPKLKQPPIWDQGQVGKCTGMAAARMKTINNMAYNVDWAGSYDYVYKNELIRQGTPNEDAGSDSRTACLVLQNEGCCHESMYHPEGENILHQMPSPAAMKDGKANVIDKFYEITTQYEMQKCLSNGFSFIFGFNCPKIIMDESFAKNPYITHENAYDFLMEDDGNGNMVKAGHELCAVGYKWINGVLFFIIANSWNTTFGDQGFFYISAEIMTDTDCVQDAYTVRLRHEPAA